jgi:drug/metabolite transporter (DMT)-like permease
VGVLACATHFDLTQLSVSPAALVMGLLCAVSSAVNSILPIPLMDRYGMLPTLGWGMLLGGAVMSLLFRPWTIHAIVNGQLIGFGY